MQPFATDDNDFTVADKSNFSERIEGTDAEDSSKKLTEEIVESFGELVTPGDLLSKDELIGNEYEIYKAEEPEKQTFQEDDTGHSSNDFFRS